MRTAEKYDQWEADHPFYDAKHSLNGLIEMWLKNNTTASKRAAYACDSDERQKLGYILYSLDQGQEYDGGNAILCATQNGYLGAETVGMLASLFLSREVRFSSKIGQMIFVKIGRSLALYLCEQGQSALGLPLCRMAVETTVGLRYGRQAARREWAEFTGDAAPLPELLHDIVRSVLE